MFEIKIQGSSSAGNNYLLVDGNSSLMIEAGLKPKDIMKKGVNFSTVRGLLITHEHGDHSKYITDILLAGGFDLWASQGTLDGLGVNRRAHALKANQQQKIGDWLVKPFATIHDDKKARAREPLGFLILSPSGKKIVFATDTNYLPKTFKNVTHWLVECNHDIELVRQSKLPKSVQDRIIKTHMSIDACKEFFQSADLTKTEEIYLIHLSDKNSDPQSFKEEIEEITNKKIIIA